jgi:hypothetical protein
MLTKPWVCNKDLDKDRILELANFIVTVRGEVIEMHDEELGDTCLSLGMRAYECCRTRIISVAESGRWSWLKILTKEGRFTFCIGNTPVRFIRNDPKYLPNKKLIVSNEAHRQMDLFFEDNHIFSSIRWFFVIDTHYKNPADTMYFVGYDELGIIQCQWTIPLEEQIPAFSTLNSERPDPIEIPEPQVGLKQKTVMKAVNEK